MITKKQLQKENTTLRAEVAKLKAKLETYQYSVPTKDQIITNQSIKNWIKQYINHNDLSFDDREINQLTYLVVQNMLKSHKAPTNYDETVNPFYITVDGPTIKSANDEEPDTNVDQLNYLSRDLQRIIQAYDYDTVTKLVTSEAFYNKYYLTAVQNSVFNAIEYQPSDIENGDAIDWLIPAKVL